MDRVITHREDGKWVLARVVLYLTLQPSRTFLIDTDTGTDTDMDTDTGDAMQAALALLVRILLADHDGSQVPPILLSDQARPGQATGKEPPWETM